MKNRQPKPLRGIRNVVFRSRGFLLASLSMTLLACPSPEDDDDTTAATDAGIVDECANASEDAGTTIVIDCNPVDGSRCDIRRNLSCVWDIVTDEGSCACLSNPQARGAVCGGTNGACEAGHVCLGLGADQEPHCYKVCNVDENVGCEGVASEDPTTAYTCAPLRRGDGALTESYGVCFGVGVSCDPFDDRCTSGQTCGVIGRATSCVAAGTQLVGQPCTDMNPCAPGGLCVALVDANGNGLGPRCYAPCKIDDPICPAGQCVEVGLPVGLCFEG